MGRIGVLELDRSRFDYFFYFISLEILDKFYRYFLNFYFFFVKNRDNNVLFIRFYFGDERRIGRCFCTMLVCGSD